MNTQTKRPWVITTEEVCEGQNEPRNATYLNEQIQCVHAIGKPWLNEKIAELLCDADSLQAKLMQSAPEMAETITRLEREKAELLEALRAAVRYIEVNTAYQGAMTAAQVEQAIKESNVSEVFIGANSCNTLARFGIANARAAIANSTGKVTR